MEYCVAAVPQRRTGELSKTRWLQVTLNHVAAGTHDLEFVCPRGGVITGKVVDSHGDPVQWMQIFARGCDDRRDHGGDETDARGEFEFGVPDDQSYDIRASPLRPDPNNPGDVLPIPDNRPEHTVEMFGVTPSGEPIVLRLP
jgi:hypothetical protein